MYFPHSWVWLEPKAEKHFDLVVIPQLDYNAYREREYPMTARVRIEGTLSREYAEPLPPYRQPAGSRYYPIGGVLNRVHIRKKSQIRLTEDKERSKEWVVALRGAIVPPDDEQRVRVELVDPQGALRVAEVETDARGDYAASFDLSYERSLQADTKKWTKSRQIVNGTYRAQAIIFGADRAAYSESNVVFLER